MSYSEWLGQQTRNAIKYLDTRPHGDASQHTEEVKRQATRIRGKGTASDFITYNVGAAYSTGTAANTKGSQIEIGPTPPSKTFGILSCANGHIEAPPMDFSGDFTIEWFMKLTPFDEYQDVYTILVDDGEQSFSNFYSTISGKFRLDETSSKYFAGQPSGVYTTWYHYAVCQRNGYRAIYINGSRASEPAVIDTGIGSGTIQIGYYEGDEPFISFISNFRITLGTALYDDLYVIPSLPLSGGDLLILKSGTTDSSGKNVPITTVGTPTWTTGTIAVAPPLFLLYGVLSSLELNLGTVTLMGEFTIEFFARFNTSDVMVTVLNIGNSFYVGQSETTISISSPTLGENETVTIPSGSLYYHYALCGKAGQVALYINGARATSKIGIDVSPDSIVLLGNSDFTGSMTNFRFINGEALYGDVYEIPTLPLKGGDILFLAKEGYPTTDSSSGAIFGGTAIWSPGPVRVASALPFQLYGVLSGFSATSFISVPSQTIDGAFTIQAFVGFQNTSSTQTLVSIGTFVVYISGGHLYVKIGTDTPIDIGTLPDGLVGSLAHFAMSGNTGGSGRIVRGALLSSVRFYINGTLIGNYNVFDTPLVLSGNLSIGYSSQGALGGSITNFMISTEVLFTGHTVEVPSLPLSGGIFLLTCSPGAPLANTGTDSSIVVTPPQTPLTVTTVTQSSPQPPAFPDYGILTGFSESQSVSYSDFSITGDFTIELFLKYTASQNYEYLFSTGDGLNVPWVNVFTDSRGLGMLINGTTETMISEILPSNSWHHLAITKSGGIWYTSINGITTPRGDHGEFSISSTCVGDNRLGDQAFSGSISNFRISKIARYTTNFSVAAPPLSSTDAYLLLLAKPGQTLVDSSENEHGHQGTCDWLAGPIPVYPYYGVLSGFTEAHYLSVETGDLSLTDFTIEWFMIPEDISGFNGAFQTENIGVGILNSNQLLINDSSTQTTYQVSDAVNNWYHYAICRQGASTNVFVNGIRVGTRTFGGLFSNLRIGYAGSPFHGFITNFRISSTSLYNNEIYTIPSLPLSGGEVLLLAKPGAVLKESTGRQVIGSAVAYLGPISVAPSLYTLGYLYEFTSLNYLTVEGFHDLNDFTLEVFVNVAEATGTQEVVTIQNGSSEFLMIEFALDSKLVIRDSTTGFQECGPFGPYNVWTHIAVSRSGNTVRVYMDGSLVKTFTSTISLNSNTLYVGNWDGSKFNGKLTNLRLSTTALYTQSTCSASLPLSGGEVLLLANPGAPFVDTNDHLVTLVGSGPSYYPPFEDYGILTGFNPLSYESFADMPAAFTVECFFKRNPGGYIFAMGTPNGIDFDSYFAVSSSLIDDRLDFEQTITLGDKYIEGVDTDTWYHVAVTRDGSNWYVSFDGYTEVWGSSTGFDNVGLRLVVGGFTIDNSSLFQGSISNFRISNFARYTDTNGYVPPSLPMTPTGTDLILLLAKPGAHFVDSSSYNRTPTGTCGWAPGPISYTPP